MCQLQELELVEIPSSPLASLFVTAAVVMDVCEALLDKINVTLAPISRSALWKIPAKPREMAIKCVLSNASDPNPMHRHSKFSDKKI